MKEVKGNILPNYFLDEKGIFKRDDAIILSGKIAGICYDEEGFNHIVNEPIEKTMRRIKSTLKNNHHSVYDHIYISFNFQNIPKILAMVLNNEHQYTTSEKSARYTPVIKEEGSIITEDEEILYSKWLEIFKVKIKARYGDVYKDNKIKKLAQENARYLVTVFMPTHMVYTTSLRQINYIASWLKEYIASANMDDYFEKNLAHSMQELLEVLSSLNVLEPELMKNEKHRAISLFGKNLASKNTIFDDAYATVYKASYAEVAQSQRHRTIYLQIEQLKEKEYFIPPILEDDEVLVDEWLHDMNVVKDNYPQGELVTVFERGIYEKFIEKCSERLCSAAQLEIMLQTKETLTKYAQALKEQNNPLYEDIQKYTKGARCTFPGFKCTEDCKFKEGKTLTRKI